MIRAALVFALAFAPVLTACGDDDNVADKLKIKDVEDLKQDLQTETADAPADESAGSVESTDAATEASGSDAGGFGAALSGDAGGSEEEIPMELMARFEGDWHGIVFYTNASGKFEELDGKKSDIAGRFSLDENGNVTPYLVSAKKELSGDMNFHDLTGELDPYFDGMYFSGWIFGDGYIDTAFIDENDGFLHSFFTVKAEDGSKMDIEFGMRHPDVPWQDSDYPMYPKEGFEYYKGCSLEEVISTFQNETPGLPEKTNITGWE